MMYSASYDPKRYTSTYTPLPAGTSTKGPGKGAGAPLKLPKITKSKVAQAFSPRDCIRDLAEIVTGHLIHSNSPRGVRHPLSELALGTQSTPETADKLVTISRTLASLDEPTRLNLGQELRKLCKGVERDTVLRIVHLGRQRIINRLARLIPSTAKTARKWAFQVIRNYNKTATVYTLSLTWQASQPRELESLAKAIVGNSAFAGLRIAAACWKKGWHVLAFSIGEMASTSQGCGAVSDFAEYCLDAADADEGIVVAWHILERMQSELVQPLTQRLLESTKYRAVATLLPFLEPDYQKVALSLLCEANRLDLAVDKLYHMGIEGIELLNTLSIDHTEKRQTAALHFLNSATACLERLEPKLQQQVYPGAVQKKKVADALAIVDNCRADARATYKGLISGINAAVEILADSRTPTLSADERQELLKACSAVIATGRWLAGRVSECMAEDSRLFLDHPMTLRQYILLLGRSYCYQSYLRPRNAPGRPHNISSFASMYLLDGDPEEHQPSGLSDLKALDLYRRVALNCESLADPRYQPIHDGLESAGEWTKWYEMSHIVFEEGDARNRILAIAQTLKLRQVESCKAGQYVIVPFGWNYRDSGHTIYGLIRRAAPTPLRSQSYHISLLNSGRGVDLHRQAPLHFSSTVKSGVDWAVSGLSLEQTHNYFKGLVPLNFNGFLENEISAVRNGLTDDQARDRAIALALRLHYGTLRDIVDRGGARRADTADVARQQLHGSCSVEGIKRLMRVLVSEQTYQPQRIESKMLVFATWLDFLPEATARRELTKTLMKYALEGIAQLSPGNAAKIVQQMAADREGWVPGATVKQIVTQLAKSGGARDIAAFFEWLARSRPELALDGLELLATTRKITARTVALNLSLRLVPLLDGDEGRKETIASRFRSNPGLLNIGDCWSELWFVHPKQEAAWQKFFREFRIPTDWIYAARQD